MNSGGALPVGRPAVPGALPGRPAVRTNRRPRSRPRDTAPAVRPESLSRSAKARAEASTKSRVLLMHVKPGMILAFSLVLCLLFFIVHASMTISEIKRENSRMSKELTEMRDTEKNLRNQYEGIYNLSEVEAYAANVKGMVKPGREQIIFIDLAGEDGAVILPKQGFWENLGSFFSAIGTGVMDFVG